MAKSSPNTQNNLDLGLTALVSEPAIVSEATNVELAEIVEISTTTPQAEFYSYITEERWTQLVSLCESRAALVSNDHLIQLGWALGSLRIGEMPANLIAGPVESVARDLLHSKAALDIQLKALTSRVLRELADKLRASSAMFMAAQFLDLAHQFDGKELERAILFTEDAIQALSLEDASAANAKMSRREQRAQREALAILLMDLKKRSVHNTSLQKDAVVIKAQDSDQPRSIPSKRSKLKSALVYTATLSALFALGYFYFGSLASEGQMLIAEQALEFGPTAMVLPVSDQRLGRHSHLDAVLYDLEQHSSNTANKSSKTGDGQSMNVAAQQTSQQVPVRQKASVNTSSPRESERPSYDRELGAANRGRSSARLYYVVVNSEVLNRPEFRSVPVAVLKRGDRVMVQGREGDWLRLRSKQGQVGYIYAQDAEPLQEH